MIKHDPSQSLGISHSESTMFLENIRELFTYVVLSPNVNYIINMYIFVYVLQGTNSIQDNMICTKLIQIWPYKMCIYPS
jgi:hypothetical protein